MSWFKELFTVYSTTRVVQVKSKFLAITYVTLVALVWSAILKSYQLDLRKIYQKRCPVRGTFTSKVKGVLSTESFSDEELAVSSPEQYKRIWDTQDIIHHTQQGFIVMTNIVITSNQIRSTCSSSSDTCETDEDCKKGEPDKAYNGILTGYCAADGKCRVSGWCPTEQDVLPLNSTRPLLEGTKNFTVLLKNIVQFPDCEELSICCGENKYRRRNLLTNFTASYLKTCRYHPVHHPFCPIFIIGDIVEWSGDDYSKVGITGGNFNIHITWNCDFDWGLTIQDCLPQYSFSRTDPSDKDTLAPGYNWRTAVFFEGNRRTLSKRYGIQFVVEVAGEGRKFDFLLLVLTIGASIGLFALAPLFCDFLFDLFCYLKSFSCCYQFFASYSKEIRYQSVESKRNRARNNRDNYPELHDGEFSSISYDTKL